MQRKTRCKKAQKTNCIKYVKDISMMEVHLPAGSQASKYRNSYNGVIKLPYSTKYQLSVSMFVVVTRHNVKWFKGYKYFSKVRHNY